ncbi:MAG: hypothetical protein QHH05_00515 [Syntrophomonadaceae bacterium]|jgi:hypothetical protein|nr:hypothetical protein [Syntrophomonadaceae bacterium]
MKTRRWVALLVALLFLVGLAGGSALAAPKAGKGLENYQAAKARVQAQVQDEQQQEEEAVQAGAVGAGSGQHLGWSKNGKGLMEQDRDCDCDCDRERDRERDRECDRECQDGICSDGSNCDQTCPGCGRALVGVIVEDGYDDGAEGTLTIDLVGYRGQVTVNFDEDTVFLGKGNAPLEDEQAREEVLVEGARVQVLVDEGMNALRVKVLQAFHPLGTGNGAQLGAQGQDDNDDDDDDSDDTTGKPGRGKGAYSRVHQMRAWK